MILAVQKIIAEGDFLLKGRTVPNFMLVLKWLKDLEVIIDEDLKNNHKKVTSE